MAPPVRPTGPRLGLRHPTCDILARPTVRPLYGTARPTDPSSSRFRVSDLRLGLGRPAVRPRYGTARPTDPTSSRRRLVLGAGLEAGYLCSLSGCCLVGFLDPYGSGCSWGFVWETPGGRDPTRCPLHVGGSWETIYAKAFIVCKEHLKSDNYRCRN